MIRVVAGVAILALNLACWESTAPGPLLRPQTLVLFATPKVVEDFENPAPSVERFLDHYMPMIARADTTILIYSVGNSDHILNYGGPDRWDEIVEWARMTDGVPVSTQVMDYFDIERAVQAVREYAAARGVVIRIYDQIDSGHEFTITNQFKYVRHPECTANEWLSFDVGAVLKADAFVYATARTGAPAGVRCGDFLVDQLAVYLEDLDFDGILYDNQLGTRGRWTPGNGPGYSSTEAANILAFFQYSRQKLGTRGLIWFDSYNNIDVERDTFSFPRGAYQYFDYLIASGFCVVTSTSRYRSNLRSKLGLRGETRVLATLDYVDPWYTYNSMADYPLESRALEQIAVSHRDQVDGVVFFANDQNGAPVPRKTVESFAQRFYR